MSVKLQPVALALLGLVGLIIIAAAVLSATGSSIPSWYEGAAFAALTAGAGVTVPQLASPAPAPVEGAQNG